ncbi:MAG: hypothetical protein ACP5OK_08720 [Thermoprotei archaeon]
MVDLTLLYFILGIIKSAFILGAWGGFSSLGILTGKLIGGVFIDALGSFRVLKVSLSLMILELLIIAYLVHLYLIGFHILILSLLILLGSIGGFLASIYDLSLTTFIGVIHERSVSVRIYSMLNAIRMLLAIMIPITWIILSQNLSPSDIIVISSLLIITGTLLSTTISFKDSRPFKVKINIIDSLANYTDIAFKIVNNNILKHLLIVYVFVGGILSAFMNMISLIIAFKALGEIGLGFINSLLAVISALLFIAFSILKLSLRRIITILYLISLLTVSLILSLTLLNYAPLVFIAAATVNIYLTLATYHLANITYTITDKDIMGKFFAFYQSSLTISAILLRIVSGVLVDIIGIKTTIAIITIPILPFILFMRLSLKKLYL